MSSKTKKLKPMWFVALVLAWLVPGAGHFYIGRKTRGIILFITIGAIFWAGIAMGGVMTVDSHYESWWFAAQSVTGIHGLIGWLRQEMVYKGLDAMPKEVLDSQQNDRLGRPGNRQMEIDHQLREKGVVVATPTDGVARAYTGVAGMLNLICIFDAVMLCLLGLYVEPARGEKKSADLKEKDGKKK